MAASIATEINIHLYASIFLHFIVHNGFSMNFPFVVQAHGVRDCPGHPGQSVVLCNPTAMLEDSMTSVKMLYRNVHQNTFSLAGAISSKPVIKIASMHCGMSFLVFLGSRLEIESLFAPTCMCFFYPVSYLI